MPSVFYNFLIYYSGQVEVHEVENSLLEVPLYEYILQNRPMKRCTVNFFNVTLTFAVSQS